VHSTSEDDQQLLVLLAAWCLKGRPANEQLERYEMGTPGGTLYQKRDARRRVERWQPMLDPLVLSSTLVIQKKTKTNIFLIFNDCDY
jgi:hypothetical protein